MNLEWCGSSWAIRSSCSKWQGTFRTPALMPRSRCSSTNALMAFTFPMTGWPVFWLPIGIPRRSRLRGISTRKSRPSCPKRQAEPTSLRRRSRPGKLRRSDDQSITVGRSCQCPDSGGHKRPSARRKRNEMVAHFFNAYFGQARCRAGGYRDYGRSKPETCRLDRPQRQEFDGNLRDPRPWRSFLWRKHNSEEISMAVGRSEEHTSELQSLTNLVCRLLLEKKKKTTNSSTLRKYAR